jgi:hypothetical protein
VTLEQIFGIVIVSVAALLLVAKILPKRKPPETFFKCARCNATARHNNRTIEAWRNNKTKFFCQSCHAHWLQTRPSQAREQFSPRVREGNSGCLGVAALFVVLPLGLLLVWAYA